MTSRTTEIQTLIADIDGLLTDKRLSKLLSSQGQQPRKVLEKIRGFLVNCTEAEIESSSKNNQQQPQLSSLLSRFIIQNNNQSLSIQNQSQQEEGNINFSENSQFSAFLAPLHAELQSLLQERANLVQEIRQLEQRRLQSYSLTQQLANQEQIIVDFLQVLTKRLGGNFQPRQLANLTNNSQDQLLTLDAANSLGTNQGNLELASASNPLLKSQDQLERLSTLANELDRRLVALDGSVNVVFEALQRNIHTYHESLSQALARMYSQGLQGEQLMTSLVNNLTQQAQLQLNSKEPFTIDIHKEPLPVEQKSLQASNIFTQTGSELLESTEFNQDSIANNSTNKVEQNNYVSSGDEVDQLYASLFGIENFLAVDSPEQSPESNIEDSAATVPQQEILEQPTTEDLAATTLSESELSSQEIFEQSTIENFAGTNPTELEVVTQEIFEELTVEDSAATTPTELEVSLPEIFEQSTTEDLAATSTTESDFVPREIVFENPNAPELPAVEYSDPTTSTESEFLDQEIVFEITGASEYVIVEDTTFSDISSGSPINAAQSANPVAAIDPWFDEPDAGLLDHGLNTQNVSEIVREQLLDLSEKITVTDQPISSDPVANLHDLSVHVQPEKLPEIKSKQNSATNLDPNHDFNESLDSDNYILASPQENLLIPADNQNIAVPEISLDHEQLHQLDRDLANFDEQGNSRLELPTNLEAQTPTEDKLTTVPSDFQLINAEQKEVAKENLEISLSSNSYLISDTETGYNPPDSVWYLGIDLGTTGISAVLLNRSTTDVYPLYWSTGNQTEEKTTQTQAFRLPAEVYLPPANAVIESQEQESTSTQNIFSAQLKPYLQIALPYRSERQKWEPVIQFNDISTAPLVWVIRSLSKLLLTLKSDRNSTTLGLTATALGLHQSVFDNAIANLAGVICNCPSQWSEQYRFNLREALLISKIVQHPQQVFFVEEAIACLLSELDGANGEVVKFSDNLSSHPAQTSEITLTGSSLVINIGALATEMALVDLPENLEDLTHNDFMLHGFAYASKGIEQDIICQLLLPAKWRQPNNLNGDNSNGNNSNPWDWQPLVPGSEQMNFADLGLEALKLPRPGEPDPMDRICLQQRLEGSLLGKAIADAAVALKLILQHQESFTLELADQRWDLHRRDLESQVFVPFVRRLNRELNKLLVAKGIPTEAINQAILTGGTSTIGAVSRWLRQKFPNAKIIQDSYLGENGTPGCSRVAYGLAMLPLHPQVLEVPRQQYTDYFLFTELLRLMPERTVSFNEIIELFESRGINTRSCQQRLLAFLEGELPAGLLPTGTDYTWLAEISRENPDYKAIAEAPLFEKQGNFNYRPHSHQLQTLRHYLDGIKASTEQSLEEPYTVNFALSVVS